MRSCWVALMACAAVLAIDEAVFRNSVWSQKHCGVPEAVHFLASGRLLLVDSRGYCLLNPQTNEVERQRSDPIDQSALTTDGTFVTLSRANRRAQFVQPGSDNLLKDFGLGPEGGLAFVATGGLYVARGATLSLLTADKTEPKAMSLGDVEVLKVAADQDDPKALEVWATPLKTESQICSFRVTADLSLATRKSCYQWPAGGTPADPLVDVFVDSARQLVRVAAGHVHINNTLHALGPAFDFRHALGVTRRLTRDRDATCVDKMAAKATRACLTTTHLRLTFDSEASTRTLTVPLTLPKDATLADFWVSPNGQTLVLATTLDSLSVLDLPKATEVLRRDESLAHVAEVAFVHKQLDADKLAYLRTYEHRLRGMNLAGAWGARMAYILGSLGGLAAAGKAALLGFLDGLRQGDLKSAFGSLLDLGLVQASRRALARKVALLFTRSGKIWGFDLETFALQGPVFLDASVRAKHEGSLDLTVPAVPPDCWVSQLDRFELLLDCRHTPRLAHAVVLNADLRLRTHTLVDAQGASTAVFRMSADRTQLVGAVAGAEAWRLVLPASETLLRIDRLQDFQVPQAAFQIENANVLYKLVDPNNALVTSREGDRLHVRVLNLRFGRLLAALSTDKADLTQGVQTLADDNGFFVAFFNSETLTQELLAIELFRKRVENDFVRILKAEFGGRERTLPDVNYSAAEPEYVALHRRFGLPVRVRALRAFDSHVDLTSKNLLAVGDTDVILSVPRTAISARRATPSERAKAEEQLARPNKAKVDILHYFRSLTLEPYAYFLPASPQQVVSGDLRIAGVRNVWVEPTSFESTSFLVATGRDLWVTLHSPNGAFDQLPEDFNKPLLWVLLVAFVVLIGVTGRLVRRKAPLARFTQAIGG